MFSWGIDRKPFHDLNEYPKFKLIQKNYKVILKELLANQLWLSWGSDDYDQGGHCNFLAGDWTVCPVYFGNYRAETMRGYTFTNDQITALNKTLPQHFPATQALLKNIQSINFAAFSKLHAKSKLAPHNHNNPLSLIYHLGLIIPPGKQCGLQVGEQTHLWTKAGQAVIFDDNFEHSAWNDSDHERIILYIDFLRFLDI